MEHHATRGLSEVPSESLRNQINLPSVKVCPSKGLWRDNVHEMGVLCRKVIFILSESVL